MFTEASMYGVEYMYRVISRPAHAERVSLEGEGLYEVVVNGRSYKILVVQNVTDTDSWQETVHDKAKNTSHLISMKRHRSIGFWFSIDGGPQLYSDYHPVLAEGGTKVPPAAVVAILAGDEPGKNWAAKWRKFRNIWS